MSKQVDTSVLLRCTYTNIRRVDRAVARFYDEALAPCGISTAQFALLATLIEVHPVTINRLAAITIVDRTTLTRNLALLTRKHLVRCEEGTDRRERLVHLTEEGEQMFYATLPSWQQAQTQIEQAFGLERFEALLAELAKIMDLVL